MTNYIIKQTNKQINKIKINKCKALKMYEGEKNIYNLNLKKGEREIWNEQL